MKEALCAIVLFVLGSFVTPASGQEVLPWAAKGSREWIAVLANEAGGDSLYLLTRGEHPSTPTLRFTIHFPSSAGFSLVHFAFVEDGQFSDPLLGLRIDDAEDNMSEYVFVGMDLVVRSRWSVKGQQMLQWTFQPLPRIQGKSCFVADMGDQIACVFPYGEAPTLIKKPANLGRFMRVPFSSGPDLVVFARGDSETSPSDPSVKPLNSESEQYVLYHLPVGADDRTPPGDPPVMDLPVRYLPMSYFYNVGVVFGYEVTADRQFAYDMNTGRLIWRGESGRSYVGLSEETILDCPTDENDPEPPRWSRLNIDTGTLETLGICPKAFNHLCNASDGYAFFLDQNHDLFSWDYRSGELIGVPVRSMQAVNGAQKVSIQDLLDSQ